MYVYSYRHFKQNFELFEMIAVKRRRNKKAETYLSVLINAFFVSNYNFHCKQKFGLGLVLFSNEYCIGTKSLS